jgi:broad specificity phosphatase PhoE
MQTKTKSGKFIFVRHGQSQANADGIIADSSSPLTEAGIEQARKTANEVREFGITAIACSPYLRAQQTAETIAGELGIDIAHITIIDELQERGLGVLENRPKEYEGTWYFTDDSSEGIEPRTALLRRMTECVGIIAKLGESQQVLVVGHAISGFYLMQVAAKKTSLEAFDSPSQMSNADFVEVNY